MTPPSPPRPAGTLAYILEDDERTRRARSLLYAAAAIVLALTVLVVSSPLVGAMLSASFSVSGLFAAVRQWRQPSSPPPREVGEAM